jgi:hypothetical protein
MFKNRKVVKAINTLNQYLTELDLVTNVQQGNTWKATLRDTLSIYIGPDSSILTRLDNLYFTTKESYVPQGKNVIGVLTRHVYKESNKETFKDLIKNAIRHIESNGIYVNPLKTNFLHALNNGQIIGGIFVAAGTIFGIGNYLGKFEKEREIIQLGKTIDSKEQYIKELEDEQNAELKTLKIQVSNHQETYEKIYKENEELKTENERQKKEIEILKKRK